MIFKYNKDKNTFLLKEDVLDRISRQAKADVSSDIAGEKAGYEASIDRIADKYFIYLQNKKDTDKPSYITILPLVWYKNKSYTQEFINDLKKYIDNINNKFLNFYTAIKLNKNIDKDTTLTLIKNIINDRYHVDTDVNTIYVSIIKNYIGFLINESLIKTLSNVNKASLFNNEGSFKDFQEQLENLLKPTESELNSYNFYLNKYNQTKSRLKTPELSESKIIKEYREEINNLLIPNMQQQLKFDRPPTINFIEDEENAKDMFGRTAHYNPNTSEITVFITGRHPKDIMRSVAHEVIHHAQNCRGEFDDAFNIGEEGYAQSNNHLRNMEGEAYLLGNLLFRDWEDNLKKQRNSNTMINEKVLRAKIRALISEMTDQGAFEVENEPAKHEEGCDCDQCSKPNKVLQNKGLAESTKKVLDAEKQVMPLNEWRRMELNSLLLNRFGIVSPEVLGEKKQKELTPKEKELAAKTPPKDKITRGDVITAAKEGDKKEKSKPSKKGKMPAGLKAYMDKKGK